MNDAAKNLRAAVRRIETIDALDRPAATMAAIAARLTRSDTASRTLSGAPMGHRLHPLLTDLPIGAWTSAAVVDLLGGRRARPAARRLVALGALTALPTAAAGLADWQHTRGGARRVGVAHAVANSVGLTLHVMSWRERRRGRHVRAKLLSITGLGAVGVGGYLGGHLVYAARIGVDVDVPVASDGWRAAQRVSELSDGAPRAVEVDGARVMLVRDRGRIHAIAEVCSHAGGPLADGRASGGCVQCPWHGSTFGLEDGSVERGPAAAPQPVYETRERDGMVEVRLARDAAAPSRPLAAAGVGSGR